MAAPEDELEQHMQTINRQIEDLKHKPEYYPAVLQQSSHCPSSGGQWLFLSAPMNQ
jgi:hypothetical protein